MGIFSLSSKVGVCFIVFRFWGVGVGGNGFCFIFVTFYEEGDVRLRLRKRGGLR